jgi:hypothetical protein
MHLSNGVRAIVALDEVQRSRGRASLVDERLASTNVFVVPRIATHDLQFVVSRALEDHVMPLRSAYIALARNNHIAEVAVFYQHGASLQNFVHESMPAGRKEFVYHPIVSG